LQLLAGSYTEAFSSRFFGAAHARFLASVGYRESIVCEYGPGIRSKGEGSQ
jgi:hypothetical protein